MKKIGIFYGSSTGTTQGIAKRYIDVYNKITGRHA